MRNNSSKYGNAVTKFKNSDAGVKAKHVKHCVYTSDFMSARQQGVNSSESVTMQCDIVSKGSTQTNYVQQGTKACQTGSRFLLKIMILLVIVAHRTII